MSNHTPGPWEVIQHGHADGDLWLSINAGKEGGMRPWIAEVKYLTAPDEEQWANARLMAAAPELLEALLGELAPSRSDCNGRRCGACSRCRSRAAILKA